MDENWLQKLAMPAACGAADAKAAMISDASSCLRPVTPSSMWQASAYTATMLIAERWWER